MRQNGYWLTTLVLGTTLLLSRPVAGQLYSENFVGADLATVGWNNSSAAAGAAGLFDHSGNNVSNEAVTPDGLDTGAVFHYMNINNAQMIWTTEFSPINPSASGGVDISWWQSEDAIQIASTVDVHVAVMVGGQWYATANAYSTNDFQDPWLRHLVTYDPTAANWRQLTLNVENVTIGAAPGSALSGSIAGLGLVTDMKTVGVGPETVWYDYIEIAAHQIPGDANGVDGVTLDDYNIIRTNYRTEVSSRAEGDLNADGFVDVLDFREWKANYSGPLDATLAVPEPRSALIILASLATVCSVSRSLKWCG